MLFSPSERAKRRFWEFFTAHVRKAGLPAELPAHSFHGTGITEYLRNRGDVEVAAQIALHESTCTTQGYNRLRKKILLDEIERIHI